MRRAVDRLSVLAFEIGPPAGAFQPFAAAERADDLGGDAIEEGAVVAHDEHGAVIACEHVLERIEGVHVEIVRRLVEHQKVRGLGERDGEGETIAFAAGQCPRDRLAQLLSGEEKFPA